VAYEPDRMLGSLNVGPRVMITREGLDRTGLILPGSRAAERFLFQLPPGAPGIAQVRDTLKKAFPEALIAADPATGRIDAVSQAAEFARTMPGSPIFIQFGSELHGLLPEKLPAQSVAFSSQLVALSLETSDDAFDRPPTATSFGQFFQNGSQYAEVVIPAQAFLQFLELCAQGGLTHVTGLGGATKASLICQRDQILQFLQCHGSPLYVFCSCTADRLQMAVNVRNV